MSAFKRYFVEHYPYNFLTCLKLAECVRYQAKSAKDLLRSGWKHHILYTIHKLYQVIINRTGSVTTPCCKLKQQVFLFILPCSLYVPVSACLYLLPFDARSLAARALSPPQQQQQQQQPFVAASASSVLWVSSSWFAWCVACFAWKLALFVAAILLVWYLELLECTCYTAIVTIELSNSGVCVASPHHTRQVRCGSFATTRERLPPSGVSFAGHTAAAASCEWRTGFTSFKKRHVPTYLSYPPLLPFFWPSRRRK